jgi:hypothetical protein
LKPKPPDWKIEENTSKIDKVIVDNLRDALSIIRTITTSGNMTEQSRFEQYTMLTESVDRG